MRNRQRHCAGLRSLDCVFFGGGRVLDSQQASAVGALPLAFARIRKWLYEAEPAVAFAAKSADRWIDLDEGIDAAGA